jgi:hypothetical protein
MIISTSQIQRLLDAYKLEDESGRSETKHRIEGKEKIDEEII